MSLQPIKTASVSVNDQKTRKLIDALRGGTDLETASAYAGLSLGHVADVIAQGQAESDRIEAGLEPDKANADALQVWQEVYKARAEAVVRAVAQIQKAANQGDWKAAAWWLERSMPNKYGQQKTERAQMPVVDYRCTNGHVVSMTRSPGDVESFPVCGICHEPMERA